MCGKCCHPLQALEKLLVHEYSMYSTHTIHMYQLRWSQVFRIAALESQCVSCDTLHTLSMQLYIFRNEKISYDILALVLYVGHQSCVIALLIVPNRLNM